MKKSGKTIAEIAINQGVSESTVLRKLKGVEPVAFIGGYQGRSVATYSKEQVAAAFPKKAKKAAKAKA